MTTEQSYRSLLEAISFAARAHRGQTRKDGETPYASHVFRVCLILRHVFGVDDSKALAAAVLHDTMEDTTTDFDELAEKFGEEIAQWVAALSKDKRLPDQEREEQYRKGLADACWQVQVGKLADIFDNLMDRIHTQPELRARTLVRSRSYLDALKSNLRPQAKRPWEIVSTLLKEFEAESAG